MSYVVGISDEAEKQVYEIDDWWRENRRSNPSLFLDELVEAINLLSTLPDIGTPFGKAKRRGVRRLLLRRSQYWVYYFYHRNRGMVYILSVWSTAREGDPKLPSIIL